jgi:hypothetical protein
MVVVRWLMQKEVDGVLILSDAASGRALGSLFPSLSTSLPLAFLPFLLTLTTSLHWVSGDA